MSKKINQLKIGVVLSYISMFLNFAINLIYTPIMIRLLGQSEYGLYTLVASFVSYLSLFSLGFTGSYLKFYSKYKNEKDETGEARLNGMFLIIFIVMALVALITGGILSQFTPQLFGTKLTIDELTKSKILMQILVVNISLTFPSAIFDSIVSAHEHFIFQRVVNILGTILNPLINLPLLLMGFDSVAMVLITTIITLFKLLVNIYYCLKKLKTKFIFNNFKIKLLKEIGVFSFFIFLNMIIDQINWSVDKFILGRVSGTNSVGIYGVGATINTVFLHLSIAVSSVFSPKLNMIASSKESKKIKDEKLSELMIKVGRIQYMILLFVGIGFVFAGQVFIRLWAGAEYSESYFVALFLILPLIIILPHNLGLEIGRAKNKHKVPAIIQLFIVLFNLIISIPLAKRFGATGSALGTFIGNIIYIFAMDYYDAKYLKINIKKLYMNILKISLRVLPAVLIGLIGLMSDRVIFTFIIGVIYSIIFVILLYRFGLNEYEKSMANRIIDKILDKFKRREKNE